MSLSIVQSAGYNTGTNAPSNPTITLTFGSAPTVGNLLVVFFGTTQTETVTTPSGWTLITSQNAASNTDCAMTAMYHYVASGDSASYNFSLSGADFFAVIGYEISGAASSNPIDQYTFSDTNGGSGGVGSNALTPTVLNELALGAVTSNNGTLNGEAENFLTSGWTLDQTQQPSWHETWGMHRSSLTSDTTTAISFFFGHDYCPDACLLLLIKPAPAIHYLSDSITVSDALQRKPRKALLDINTVSDRVVRFIARHLPDSFSPVDRLLRNPRKNLPETITALDRLTRSARKKLPDTVAPVDRIAKTQGRPLADTVSPVDSLTRSPRKALPDTIVPADQVTRLPKKTLPDTVAPTDHIAKTQTRPLGDAVSPLDSLRRSPNKALPDIVSPSDQLSWSCRKRFPDTLLPVDRLARIPTKRLADTVSPLDRLTRFTIRAFQDAISMLDAVKRRTGKALSEALSLISGVVAHRTKAVILGDSISLLDKVFRHTSRALADAITPVDTIVRHTTRKLRDALSILDAFIHRFSWPVRLSDAVTLHDAVTRNTRKNLSDSFSLTDAFDYLLRLPGAVRRFLAQLWRRIFRASEEDLMICDVRKPAGSSEDFAIDWTSVLSSGDTITASEWMASPSDMAVANSSYTTTTATAQLAAGTIGTYYVVENTVTLASGQTKVQSLLILVTE